MNKQRFEVLDVLRGLAVVFMVMVHVMNVFADFDGPGETSRVLIDFLGGPPAAPVFMVIMGFLFARKDFMDLSGNIKRGVQLLFIGYLLNFFRGVVPVFIGKEIMQLPADHFSPMYTYEYLFLTVDILIFAGLAFICMSLIFRFSRKLWMWELIACAIAFFSSFLWGRGEEIPVLGRIIEPLWGNNQDLVTFPLFPWLFFPLQGMVIGKLRDGFSKHYYLFLLSAGCAAITVAIIPLVKDFDRFFNDYGQMKAAGLFAIGGFVLLWGLFIGFLDKFFPARLKTRAISFLGKYLTSFYVIHWMIIGWMRLLIPHGCLSTGMVLAVSLGVTIVSGFLVKFYLRIKLFFREAVLCIVCVAAFATGSIVRIYVLRRNLFVKFDE